MSFPPPTAKQARVIWFCLTAMAVALLIALGGMVLWGAGWLINRLSQVLLPLGVAGIIAYVLDPATNLLERWGIPRVRAILLVFLAGIVMVLCLLVAVVPSLIIQTEVMVDELPEDLRKLQSSVNRWTTTSAFGSRLVRILNRVESPRGGARGQGGGTNAPPQAPTNPPPGAASAAIPVAGTGATNSSAKPGGGSKQVPAQGLDSALAETVYPWLARVLPALARWLGDQLSKAASWAGLLAGLALVPVYAFYFLLEKSGIQKQWTDYLPMHESKAKEEIVFILTSINDCLIVFFRGQVLVALCVGGMLTVGFLLLGLKYALVLGVVAGLLGIIPYLGVMLSIIPAVTIALVQFGTWYHPVLVLCVFGAVQMTEGLLITPRIIGDRVGLHPLTIIVAVLVGATLLGGLLGGMLAIPLTAALRVLMFRYVWKRRVA